LGFPPLSDAEARVLGCLVEKQLTTPDSYPLTLNAVMAACNQKNNRHPVTDYDERTLARALDALREKRLVWLVGQPGRVPKYEHHLLECISVADPGQVAVLCELMVRGPQTAGELRSRAGRMHSFSSRGEVQDALDEMAARPVPLVVRLPRQPGCKECRYLHTLADMPETASGTEPSPLPPPEPTRAELQAEAVRLAQLEQDCRQLRDDVAALRRDLDALREQLGTP